MPEVNALPRPADEAAVVTKAVLRAALRESTLEPVAAPDTALRRSITISPASGGEVTLRRRSRAPAPLATA